MKIKFNKNILWSKVFVEQLTRLGIKNACLSPGSRNTPLTYAVAANKKIKSMVFVDERSSAFYALGIAKQTGLPVLVVTTSGTAVAELYPAIIEAYKSRVPLIICTADRPPSLRNKGANQTINQNNIYKNHIRYFTELSLPSVSERSISKLKNETIKAFNISLSFDRGPVHLNFPFEKPFEPDSFTDIISNNDLKKIWTFNPPGKAIKKTTYKNGLASIALAKYSITHSKKGIILCGNGYYDNSFPKILADFSKKTGFPIVADGASGLRFGYHCQNQIIANYSSFCRIPKFGKFYDPDLIIQFGAAPTSISLLDFYKKSKAEKYLINEYGDWNDPSDTAKQVIRYTSHDFCRIVLEKIGKRKTSYGWFNELRTIDLIAGKLKNVFINNQLFPFEGRLVNDIISSLPDKCNLIVSNSLPIRDFDSFANTLSKGINVFTNRGASGIDGLISTSLGIASQSPLPTYLVIGDLAFYHDMNALALNNRNLISMQIILINNNGGGIFEHLPISRQKDLFEEYFKTPLNLDYGKIIYGYGCGHQLISNWSDLRKRIKGFNKKKLIEVIEIQTNAEDSFRIRNDYWREIESMLE